MRSALGREGLGIQLACLPDLEDVSKRVAAVCGDGDVVRSFDAVLDGFPMEGHVRLETLVFCPAVIHDQADMSQAELIGWTIGWLWFWMNRVLELPDFEISPSGLDDVPQGFGFLQLENLLRIGRGIDGPDLDGLEPQYSAVEVQSLLQVRNHDGRVMNAEYCHAAPNSSGTQARHVALDQMPISPAGSRVYRISRSWGQVNLFVDYLSWFSSTFMYSDQAESEIVPSPR